MSPDPVPPLDPNRLADLLGQAVGGLEPRPDGIARITTGIARRRRLHQAGLAAATVVAVAGVSIAGVSLRSTSAPARFGTGASSSPTTSMPTLTPSTSPQPTPVAPTALPVPAGFRASSVSAISASVWWVGGSVPCGTAQRCPAMASTTDSGQHFRAITVPGLGTLSEQPGLTVRFATSSDGWVYGTSSIGPYLFATHDGGVGWKAQPAALAGTLIRLEAAGGRVYALVRGSTNQIPNRLYSSPLTTDDWTLLATPHPENGYRAGFTVVGHSVWLEGASTGSSGQPPKALYVSRDRGVTFSTETDPCTPDLGGTFDAHGANVVWAFCATGTQGSPYLSVDGGSTFTPLVAHDMWANSTGVAAISDSVGFLYGTAVQVTRDGGHTFSAVVAGRPGDQVQFVGFTDDLHGFVVNAFGELLRSDDAGRTFRAVLVK